MFCGVCGKPIPDGARFCGSCGTPVAAVDTPPAPAPSPVIRLYLATSGLTLADIREVVLIDFIALKAADMVRVE